MNYSNNQINNYHNQLSQNQFGLIELMHPRIHGEYNNTSQSPEWYVSYFNQDAEYENVSTENTTTMILGIAEVEKQKHQQENNWFMRYHDDIPNYLSIVSSEKYLKPSIFKYYINSQNVMCAVDNTFWLRILQRTIRKRIRQHNAENVDPEYNLDNIQNNSNENLEPRLYYSGGVWYRYN